MTDPFRAQLQQALGTSYEILRELEGGGMSRVFVAREKALDRDVVVKVLPPELAAGVNRDRFRREIQLAAQLQHPHIVPLLSAGESGDLLYYTMPFIAGESLKTALAKHGKLAVRDVVRILHDVVDALAYAHEHGVIHRDIKPANVLMSGTHAVITDFGVAKALSAAMPISGFTTAGVAIGTPAYMAPEQLAADPSADHRVDIYAVGLLAYELFTGESPFTGPSPAATMAAQLTREPEPLFTCCPEVPEDLSAVVMKCLAKQPAERWSTARELLEQLDSVSTPYGGVYATGTMTKRRGVSRRYVALLSVLLTVAIASALALSYNRRGAVNQTTRAAVPVVADTPISRTLVPSPATPNVSPPRASSSSAAASLELTPAESLAIAKAVQRRLAETQQRASVVDADSLRESIQRSVIDSLARSRTFVYQVMIDSMRHELDSLVRWRSLPGRADDRNWERNLARSMESIRRLPQTYVVPAFPEGEMPGMNEFRTYDSTRARRVVVASQFVNGTASANVSGYARAAAESLRARVRARGLYELVTVDSATDRRLMSDPMGGASATRSGFALSGFFIGRRDSVYLQVHAVDMRRGMSFRGFKGPAAPFDDPLRGADDVWRQVLEWMERPERGVRTVPGVQRGPRSAPVPPTNP